MGDWRTGSFDGRLWSGAFLLVDSGDAKNFSIPRVRRASFGFGMTSGLALQIVQALQKQIRKYSDFEKLQQVV
jgi:hypothetical protein